MVASPATKPPAWTPELDAELRRLRPIMIYEDLQRHFGTTRWHISIRVKHLDLGRPNMSVVRQPMQEEWIRVATEIAKAAGVSPSDLMAGERSWTVSKARAVAWREMAARNTRWTVSGIARVTGFHSTSICKALGRLKKKPSHRVIITKPLKAPKIIARTPIFVRADSIPAGIRAIPRQKVA